MDSAFFSSMAADLSLPLLMKALAAATCWSAFLSEQAVAHAMAAMMAGIVLRLKERIRANHPDRFDVRDDIES